MKVDFHVHTKRSVDGVHSPRVMVKAAREAGLDAIAITDHNHLFPGREAEHLSREFGIVVIPGIEGGNITVQKHWIALGIGEQIPDIAIHDVLARIRGENGLSIAPHPHIRLGFADYALLGFDAVESLNGSEPASNRLIQNSQQVSEVAGSDAHAVPMLGSCWTDVDADGSVGSILESVCQGRCHPAGAPIPLNDYLSFYPLYLRHRILEDPAAAFAAALRVLHDARRARDYESSCQNCRTSA